MLIEVKGVQFVNKGAELMLHAVLQQMRLYWPDAQLVLFPSPNSSYQARAALGALQRLPLRKGPIDLNFLAPLVPKKVRRWLQFNLGIVFAVDIDLVLDASGFAYGDQWPQANSAALCADIRRFANKNKAYIILPQALGPFSRQQEIIRLKRDLPKVTLICAREQSSFDYVRTLIGDAGNLQQFPDFTNLVSGVVPDYYLNGDNKVLIIPNANMLSSRNNHSGWRQNYVDTLVSAVAVVKELGFLPVLLNHEGNADGDICSVIQQNCAGEVIELITEQDPLKVKGIIGASKAVICSRFHGCVSALSQGVPCLGTSWSHKYERLFDEYGQLNALLQPGMSQPELMQKMRDVLNCDNIDELKKHSADIKLHSQAMWQSVAGAISQTLTK